MATFNSFSRNSPPNFEQRKKPIMKRLILLFSLIVFLASCGNMRHSNFSKQKFTNLKQVKKTYEQEEADQVSFLDPVSTPKDTITYECDTLYFKSGKTLSCTILREDTYEKI